MEQKLVDEIIKMSNRCETSHLSLPRATIAISSDNLYECLNAPRRTMMNAIQTLNPYALFKPELNKFDSKLLQKIKDFNF